MPPKVHFHKRREKYVLYFPYFIYFDFEVNLVARAFLALMRIYFIFEIFDFETVCQSPSATLQNIPKYIHIFLSTLIAWHRNYNTKLVTEPLKNLRLPPKNEKTKRYV